MNFLSWPLQRERGNWLLTQRVSGHDDKGSSVDPRRISQARRFWNEVPHNVALGIEVVTLEPGVCCARLPHRVELVGNPETGVLHGGVITALLDVTCGAAVDMALRTPRPLATLDLRIDYLAPATPGRDVDCRAVCHRVTRHVAFVRGIAYHGTEEAAIATATATFALGRRGGPGAVAEEAG